MIIKLYNIIEIGVDNWTKYMRIIIMNQFVNNNDNYNDNTNNNDNDNNNTNNNDNDNNNNNNCSFQKYFHNKIK